MCSISSVVNDQHWRGKMGKLEIWRSLTMRDLVYKPRERSGYENFSEISPLFRAKNCYLRGKKGKGGARN